MLEDDYRRRLNELFLSCPFEATIPDQWRDVLTRQGVISPVPNDQRRFVRYHFCTRAILELAQTHPAMARQHSFHHVLTRDLSRTGIAFLHREQLYPGEQVVLWLPRGKQRFTVIRCQRHNQRSYEIGATVQSTVQTA